MAQLSHRDSPLVEPIYSQVSSCDAIDFGTIKVQFTHNGKSYSENAKAILRFVPRERLVFIIPMPASSAFGLDFAFPGWEGELQLGDDAVSTTAFCTAIGEKYGGIVLQPTTSGITVTLPTDTIETAIFHLFNFPEIRGPNDYILKLGEQPYQGATACGSVVLSADGWTVTIAATGETRNQVAQLKAQGGYMITHVGSIARSDNSTFSSTQLEEFLTCVHYFLSFALGRWAGLSLPVGFDANNDRVFEQWGIRRAASGPWNGSCSWFDAHRGELLSEVFPGFVLLWNSPVWRRPLTEAVYWYLAANEGATEIGADTGLILAQTAMELLAWTHCVQDRRMVSANAFGRRGLSAADKLRLLASSFGIPLTIPAELRSLFAKKGSSWTDSMDAITGIRNSLVHPDSKSQLPSGSYYDGWRLSLWYLDLVLLQLCGHAGKYANRLTGRYVGQVEQVPWATTTT